MSVHPCREPECVGVASVAGGQCVPHAAGYRKRPKRGPDLRCGQCRRLIQPESWYRLIDGEQRHLGDCKPHPDVVAARETKARQSMARR